MQVKKKKNSDDFALVLKHIVIQLEDKNQLWMKKWEDD